jgi:hypothetical protein
MVMTGKFFGASGVAMPMARRDYWEYRATTLKQNDRHFALARCLSMIFCKKPYPLFKIML